MILLQNGMLRLGRDGTTLCALREEPFVYPPVSLAGETALVTGGGAGIGLAIARALLQAGAKVLLTGRKERDVSALLPGAEGAAYMVWDVSDAERAQDCLRTAREKLGGLTILVNNAGVTFRTPGAGSFFTATEADYDHCVNTNAAGCYALCRAALADFGARGGGRILNIVSNTALRPAHLAYHVSKRMQAALTRGFAAEAPAGVSVCGVAPGPSMTDMTWHTGQSVLRENAPAGRIAHPREIAALALFALGQGESLNGQILCMDGGQRLK